MLKGKGEGDIDYEIKSFTDKKRAGWASEGCIRLWARKWRRERVWRGGGRGGSLAIILMSSSTAGTNGPKLQASRDLTHLALEVDNTR
jgi:hypothetical protein